MSVEGMCPWDYVRSQKMGIPTRTVYIAVITKPEPPPKDTKIPEIITQTIKNEYPVGTKIQPSPTWSKDSGWNYDTEVRLTTRSLYDGLCSSVRNKLGLHHSFPNGTKATELRGEIIVRWHQYGVGRRHLTTVVTKQNWEQVKERLVVDHEGLSAKIEVWSEKIPGAKPRETVPRETLEEEEARLRRARERQCSIDSRLSAKEQGFYGDMTPSNEGRRAQERAARRRSLVYSFDGIDTSLSQEEEAGDTVLSAREARKRARQKARKDSGHVEEEIDEGDEYTPGWHTRANSWASAMLGPDCPNANDMPAM